MFKTALAECRSVFRAIRRARPIAVPLVKQHQLRRLGSTPSLTQHQTISELDLNNYWMLQNMRGSHENEGTRQLTFVRHCLGLEEEAPPSNVAFVCIDCEAYEDDHSKITEIGVAVLDTADIAGIEPGSKAETWISKIKACHLRPVEYKDLVNRKFVKGRENAFSFGESIWISIEDAGDIMRRIIAAPASMENAVDVTRTLPLDRTKVVVVGHGLQNEVKFLNEIGFSWSREANVLRTVDTQLVPGGSKKTGPGLSRLLRILDIEAENLHNAGNDAVYTLQSLLGMVVKEAGAAGSVLSGVLGDRSTKAAAKKLRVEQAQLQLNDKIQTTVDSPVEPNIGQTSDEPAAAAILSDEASHQEDAAGLKRYAQFDHDSIVPEPKRPAPEPERPASEPERPVPRKETAAATTLSSSYAPF